jgi:hypothetical protein
LRFSKGLFSRRSADSYIDYVLDFKALEIFVYSKPSAHMYRPTKYLKDSKIEYC